MACPVLGLHDGLTDQPRSEVCNDHRMFDPYFSSFLDHGYGDEPANELKSVLKHPNFRFGPSSPTNS